jgi:hypothetical protein
MSVRGSFGGLPNRIHSMSENFADYLWIAVIKYDDDDYLRMHHINLAAKRQ